MANTGHRWTDAEERAALTFVYDEFRLIYPDITKDAYRLRRASLLKAKPARSGIRAIVHRLVCGG